MSTFRTFAFGAIATALFVLPPHGVFAQETETPPPPQPPSSDLYAFQRQGVFGCSLNGSYSMSVGAMSAVGGAYVPVNDAAVTLNTGFLVYKECILRGIVNREAEAALSALQKTGVNSFLTGRNGSAYFPTDLAADRLSERDRVYLLLLQNGSLDTLNPALKGPLTRAAAQGYMAARNKPNSIFACPYTELDALYKNGNYSGSVWSGLSAIGTPGCNPLIANTLVSEYLNAGAAQAVDDMMTKLSLGEGCYPVEDIDAEGNRITRTPGSLVCSNIQQLLQTGFKRLENANDIDQMVGALFAGVTSHILGDSRGLSGIIQRTGSQPSYLDKVVLESQQGVRNSAINAALQILGASKQVEAAYKQVMEGIARVLSDTIATLRSRENACWALVVEKVCASAPNAQKECTAKTECTTDQQTGQTTCPTGATLKVATSTAFSQGVINAQIAPLASSTVINIENATKAIGLVDQLIAGVTNTASLNAQRIALQQLDTLVSQRALHTQYDLQAAKETEQDVVTRMGTVRDDTTTAWGDSTDPNIGWCNVNSPTVVNMWIERWKK